VKTGGPELEDQCTCSEYHQLFLRALISQSSLKEGQKADVFEEVTWSCPFEKQEVEQCKDKKILLSVQSELAIIKVVM
jgi:hypothetical protein